MSTFVTSVAIFNSSPSDSNVILFESLSGCSFCSLGANPSKLLSVIIFFVLLSVFFMLIYS